jgi:hypothetical protein
MPTLAQIAIFLGVGLAGGFVFFGVLDRINARLARKAEDEGAPETGGTVNTTRAIAATLVVRVVLLGGMLVAALRYGIGTMLATFVGAMIARAVCLHFWPERVEEQDKE